MRRPYITRSLKGLLMQYGKIALKVLAVFGATVALTFVLRPG